MSDLPQEKLIKMYEFALKIRYFEEKLGEIYYEGKKPFDIAKGPIPGEMHLSSGQEASAVGVCVDLHDDDAVVATHRAHHFAIAKGVDLNKMTAEIFGKKTGLSSGKGGHMHLFDKNVNFSCSGIVGASFPQALGVGLASKIENKDYIAVAVGGDGAANQGTFAESLNIAALWKLPVIFVIEDNNWAISVNKKDSTAGNICDRAKGYGIPAECVDGENILNVYKSAKKAIERARNGDGPSVIEVKVSRLRGHFEGDPQIYRTQEDFDEAKSKDPLKKFENYLLNEKIIDRAKIENINKQVVDEVHGAIQFARDSEYPNPDEAISNVFLEDRNG